MSIPLHGLTGQRFENKGTGRVYTVGYGHVVVEKALDAAENYYLLYYSPKNRILDGDFRNINVKIKQGKYRITHRLGYFAD